MPISINISLITMVLMGMTYASQDIPLIFLSGESHFFGQDVRLNDGDSLNLKFFLLSLMDNSNINDAYWNKRQERPEMVVVYTVDKLRSDEFLLRSAYPELKKLIYRGTSVFVPYYGFTHSIEYEMLEVERIAKIKGLYHEIDEDFPINIASKLKEHPEILENEKTDLFICHLPAGKEDITLKQVNDIVESYTTNYISVFVPLDYNDYQIQEFNVKENEKRDMEYFWDDPSPDTNCTQHPNAEGCETFEMWFYFYFPGVFWEGFFAMLVILFWAIVGSKLLFGLQSPEKFRKPPKKN